MSLRRVTLLGVVGLLSMPLSARGQNTGFTVSRFDPSQRGSEWFANESLDLRGHVRPTVGVVVDGAYRPLVLYNQDDSVNASIVRNQIFLHPGASLVLWERLRASVSLPVVVYQDGRTGTLEVPTGSGNFVTYTPPDTPAIGDLRLGLDARLVGEYGDAFTLALGVNLHLPSGNRADFTGDETVRAEPRVMVAGDLPAHGDTSFVYSARAGVQLRPHDVSFAGTKLGHELPFAAAAGVRTLNRQLVIGPELFGSTVLANAFEEQNTPVDLIFGAHLTVANALRIGGGGGLGLTRGLGSPVGRWMALVEWAPGMRSDRDGDGIYDDEDACPDVRGRKSDDPKQNGCPAPEPSDRDKDGILDTNDACADTPGVKTDDPKTNGCPPDRDKDGILDAEDACPDVAGVKTDDPKTNGCPPDRDKDGVVDAEDACPDVAGLKTSDPKTNGCPAPQDRDNDTITDDKDACPDQPGQPNADPKKNGCPKAFISDKQIQILEQVKFATASAVIPVGADGDHVLEEVAKLLKDSPQIAKIRIEGHTDDRGDAKMNKDLSKRRAASVLQWLVKHGIEAKRMTSDGFGMERPRDTNATEEGRHNNRRVEFHIVEDQAGGATTPNAPTTPKAPPAPQPKP